MTLIFTIVSRPKIHLYKYIYIHKKHNYKYYKYISRIYIMTHATPKVTVHTQPRHE